MIASQTPLERLNCRATELGLSISGSNTAPATPTTSQADNRRRHLVLDLSGRSDIVPRSELRTLTPRLAAAYADKTSKTLTRDLNVLQDMGLITRSSEGIVANKEMIRAFLPRTSPTEAPS